MYLGVVKRISCKIAVWLTLMLFCLAPASRLGMSLSRVSTSCDNSEIWVR